MISRVPPKIGFGLLAVCFLTMSGCQALRVSHPARLPAEGANAGRYEHPSADAITPPLTEVWRYNAHAGFGPAAPLIVEDLLFVGTRQGEVHVIEMGTGSKVGSQEFDEAVNGSLGYRNRVLFVPIAWGGRSVMAYDLVDGDTNWEIEGAPVPGGVRVSSSLVLAPDSRGTLTAYEAGTGSIEWQRSLENTSFHGAPVLLGDKNVLVAAEDGRVRVFSIREGLPVWQTRLPAPVYATPGVGPEHVYLPTTRGKLFALDRGGGAVAWFYETPDSTIRFTKPVFADGQLYVGRSDGAVVALDAETGAQLWQYHAHDAVTAPPLAAGSTIYVGTMGGYLVALDAETGRRLWRYELTGRVKSAMAARDGRLVVLAEPRYVYLFESSARPSVVTR